MISGDPAATLLGTQATPEKVEALRTEMGLNRPMLVRYGEWLAGFFTGNLGVSFQYRQPVQALLGPKMLVTLCLSLVSFVLIVVVSLPLGLLSANGKLEGLHTFSNQFCMAVPPFFTGILISWCFGIFLQVFVPGDFQDWTGTLASLWCTYSLPPCPSPSPGGYDCADAAQHGHQRDEQALCPHGHCPWQ